MTELSLPLIGECRVRRGPTLPPSESTATLPLPSTLSHAENRSWGTRVASAQVMAPAASKSKAYSSGVATQAGTSSHPLDSRPHTLG
mgnify:CR=1 FL=1|jgi:hypothetical protein